MTAGNAVREPVSLRGRVITQLIAFVCFLVMPVVITLVAPLSTLEFDRTRSEVAVVVTRYALIVVPWQTRRIERVTGIRADITPEKHYRGTSEERRKGQKGTRLSTGQVAILNDGPEVIVQADPELAREIVARFQRFAGDRAARTESIQVYASWWLSYVLGGVVTALCALYVFGVVATILSLPFKLLRGRPAGP